MGEQKRMAECHPDRPYHAKGLCTSCYNSKYKREKYENNFEYAEACRAKGREYYERNKDKAREYREENQEWRSKQNRSWRLKTIYGITPEEYNEILRSQGNKCAICGMTPEENGKNLSVDHDHKTGKVRGLLCHKCNTGLGALGDYLDILWSTVTYLGGVIKFKKISPEARIPTRKFSLDSGLDIYALKTTYIPAREQAVMQTGIALASLSPYFVIQIWSKSGLDSRLGLHVGAGIVDPNYRGEILVLLKNMSDYPIGINKGDAIAQLVIVQCMRPDIEIVDDIEATDRGEQGGINANANVGR